MHCTAGLNTDGPVSQKFGDQKGVFKKMQWHTVDLNLTPEFKYSMLLCCQFKGILVYIPNYKLISLQK